MNDALDTPKAFQRIAPRENLREGFDTPQAFRRIVPREKIKRDKPTKPTSIKREVR